MSVAPEFAAWTKAPAGDELRLIPIGGLGEFGMNALVVHSARSLFLVDCGQLFPSDDQPGIDSIVPDFAYLEPFAEDLQAVLLTHGHEDHIGAVQHLLSAVQLPLYATPLTRGLIEVKLARNGVVAITANMRQSPFAQRATPAAVTAVDVPKGNGVPVITDGIFSPGEWDDALRVALSEDGAVTLHLKEYGGVVFIGIRGGVEQAADKRIFFVDADRSDCGIVHESACGRIAQSASERCGDLYVWQFLSVDGPARGIADPFRHGIPLGGCTGRAGHGSLSCAKRTANPH